MCTRMFYMFVSLIILGIATIIISSTPETVYADFPAADMGQVIGAGNCLACYDYCGGGGCPDSRCNGSSDQGELCGNVGGLQSAWVCLSWNATSVDNCQAIGDSVRCSALSCHCDDSSHCVYDGTYSHPLGNADCTD